MDNITEPDCLDTAVYSCVLRWGRANDYIVTCSPGNKAGIRLKASGVIVWFTRAYTEGGLNVIIADQHDHFMASSLQVYDVLAFEHALTMLILELSAVESDPGQHCLQQIQRALQMFETLASGNVDIDGQGRHICSARPAASSVASTLQLFAAMAPLGLDTVASATHSLLEPLLRPDMVAQRVLGAIQYGLKHRERFEHG